MRGVLLACALLTGCAASSSQSSPSPDGGLDGVGSGDAIATDTRSGDVTSTGCGTCPSGYTCGSANGHAVCRAPSGVPLFTNVFLILMENTSLSTLQAAMQAGNAPNLKMLAGTYATGADYHGVAHPSLPNYIALTSGDTQGIGCDCHAAPNMGTC